MDEELFGIFRFARTVVTPFKEICLELVLQLQQDWITRVLDMPPDATMNGQELKVKFRRNFTLQSVLSEALGMYLATAHELLEHFRYLRSSPSKAAALIAPPSDEKSEETKKLVVSQMKSEWELVLRLESSAASACELQEHCRHVSYQCYRELMAVWEKHSWKVHPEALSLTRAWYPELAWSSNIESLFKEMTSAVKRSGQSDVGSLPNLMAVAIRGLHRRLCISEDAPQALKLEKDDWSGAQTPALKPKIFNPTSAPVCRTDVNVISVSFFHWSHGQAVSIDSITKPFPSTSAFHHNHHSLNFMAGLMLADSPLARMGRDPVNEIQFFWVPAVQLKELPFSFKGPLPDLAVDETNIPMNDEKSPDPLSTNQSTHALTLDVGRNLVRKLLLRPDEVRFFGYSIHLAEPVLSDKCGCSILLRRGMKDFSLMGWLVQSGDVLKLTVRNLIDFMDSRGARMPKNATKAQRIRRILSMDDIQQECSADVINAMVQKLEQQEEKRRQKEEKGTDPTTEGEIHWEVLEEDAATAACRQLLGQQHDDEDEDDAEEASKLHLVGDASFLPMSLSLSRSLFCLVAQYATNHPRVFPQVVVLSEVAQGPTDEPMTDARPAVPDGRASRALLSNACALPPELVSELPLPEGTAMHMVLHKDRTLPHFQGRLTSGEVWDGKPLV
ncbi:unnamed protein product [Symbiodinium necroappetens]|uniref:Uncharacterized protein n=1 Tax=Symbiodinium necroappetens TaxID=1628268 RepID=A0A812QZP8_9DINO|nr:unnamed protein product [Symbiodinium necroappetens]